MEKIKYLLRLLLLSFFLFNTMEAEIRLPSIISDHMVIQQKTTVPIWGWGRNGEEVKIKGSWMNEEVKTITDENGKWFIKIQSPSGGGVYNISIKGENTIIINDVLAGEVWLASGQSNMAFKLKNAENAGEAIASSDYPEIRFFQVEHTYSDKPQENCNGEWIISSPKTSSEFSAVAYFFAKEIYKKINAPVGMISSSKGGSPVESWININEYGADNAVISELFKMWQEWKEKYPIEKKKYELELSNSMKASKEKPRKPVSVSMIEKPHRRPGYLYNAMIAPIVPYTIKGVIWYQGENNTDRPFQYRKLFPMMISDWRKEWNLGDFPFYYVQIASYNCKKDFDSSSYLREAQLMTMKVPNTGMVVTSDISELDNIHPRNKLDVGKRLALWALAKTYGFKDIVCSGPLYRSFKIEGNKIRLFFDYIGSGLVQKDKKLTEFEIAGSDKKFKKATAEIEDSTVVVYNLNISDPVAVRYCWSMISIPKLYNKEGLPAAPFRTDNW